MNQFFKYTILKLNFLVFNAVHSYIRYEVTHIELIRRTLIVFHNYADGAK